MSETEKSTAGKEDSTTREEFILAPERQESFDEDKTTKSHPDDVKLDKHGLPLVPQPSDNQDDPLVRSIIVAQDAHS
jgi:hypothetical protein